MHLDQIRDLLDQQCGVVSRRQLISSGADPNDVRRWLRRGELVVVHPGVYLNHTGPVSWASRSWAAVQRYWPAALSHESVVHAAGHPVHVAIDVTRSPTSTPGIRVHRLTDLDDRVQWSTSPPRVRLEDAVLSLCAQAGTRIKALEVAADACRRRRTTPERLLAALDGRSRLSNRGWLREVLVETADGVQSPLESSYLRRVERAHGLPRGRRQLAERTSSGMVYRDVVYDRQRVVVELDGRVGHELSADRWRDMDRDLEAATDDKITLRIGWRHTEVRPCETAGRIGAVLRLRAWRGSPRRCGPRCRMTVPIGVTG